MIQSATAMADRISFKSQYMVLMAFAMLVNTVAAFAQSDENVSLDIPIDAFISATNTWVEELAPVVAITTGIAIALAVLGFIGNAIIKGFRGA